MFGALIKAARGAASADELLEMLSTLGVEAEIKELDKQGAAAILRADAKLSLLDARLKTGQRVLAIMVLPKAGL